MNKQQATEIFFSTHLPTTRDEAVQFLQANVFAGFGVHPDDDAADWINSETGEATFTAAQAALINSKMEACFSLVEDPYAVVLDVLMELDNA